MRLTRTRLILLLLTASSCGVLGQQNDYADYGDYNDQNDYRDNGDYQEYADDYGQQDSLYHDYAARQQEKGTAVAG